MQTHILKTADRKKKEQVNRQAGRQASSAKHPKPETPDPVQSKCQAQKVLNLKTPKPQTVVVQSMPGHWSRSPRVTATAAR